MRRIERGALAYRRLPVMLRISQAITARISRTIPTQSRKLTASTNPPTRARMIAMMMIAMKMPFMS